MLSPLPFLRFRKLIGKKNLCRILDVQEFDHLIDLFACKCTIVIDFAIQSKLIYAEIFRQFLLFYVPEC